MLSKGEKLSCDSRIVLCILCCVVGVLGGAQAFNCYGSKSILFLVKACKTIKKGRLKLHVPNKFKGVPQTIFASVIIIY